MWWMHKMLHSLWPTPPPVFLLLKVAHVRPTPSWLISCYRTWGIGLRFFSREAPVGCFLGRSHLVNKQDLPTSTSPDGDTRHAFYNRSHMDPPFFVLQKIHTILPFLFLLCFLILLQLGLIFILFHLWIWNNINKRKRSVASSQYTRIWYILRFASWTLMNPEGFEKWL